jgi:type I protein arginine methyltransferase
MSYISSLIRSLTFLFFLCEAPIHGFGFWFEVEFNEPAESSHDFPSNLDPVEIIQKKWRRSSEDTVLSTAPEDEPTHWQQVLFLIMVFSIPIELISVFLLF